MGAAAPDCHRRCDSTAAAEGGEEPRWQGEKGWSEGGELGITNIGGIEDASLIPMLNDIINGHSSLQRLNESCALVKARTKVQTVVLQDANIDLDDWEDALRKFPLACHDQFIERWAVTLVREGVRARDSLPDTFFGTQ